MEHSDAKANFAEGLRLLSREHMTAQHVLRCMFGQINSLIFEFSYASEPARLERHLVAMARCSWYFSRQLKGALKLFDCFVQNVKRNAPIEQYFLQSEDEEWSTAEGDDGADADFPADGRAVQVTSPSDEHGNKASPFSIELSKQASLSHSESKLSLNPLLSLDELSVPGNSFHADSKLSCNNILDSDVEAPRHEPVSSDPEAPFESFLSESPPKEPLRNLGRKIKKICKKTLKVGAAAN